nr:putative reverse transcriptase domain-containing protein [Tanacetum cinerariifolium]
MDWLSKRKSMIVCHEKVVRIPLEGDEVIWVHGERTQGVVKTLMNTKVDEPKLSDIFIIRDFIDVFPEVAKPPYRLAPSEMQQLSEQLRELESSKLTVKNRYPLPKIDELFDQLRGAFRFGKNGTLAPRYVGSFKILERIGLVAYRLRLPEELNSVHDTFHVSNLKRCLADANLKIALVKVRWNSKRGPEFTGEHKEQMRIKFVIRLEMAKSSFE